MGGHSRAFADSRNRLAWELPIQPAHAEQHVSLIFEWDARKARANLRKHRFGFEEAVTVFADPLSATVDDSLHPGSESRYMIVGCSENQRVLVVVHTDRGDRIRLVSARLAHGANEKSMKTRGPTTRVAEMKKEYDFSRGIRGKYIARIAAGRRIVVLDPDVARFFPDSKSVNEVLRVLAAVLKRRGRKVS